MDQQNEQIMGELSPEVLSSFRSRMPKTKADLDAYLRGFFGFFLASVPIEPGNSCPLDFAWDIFSSAMDLKPQTTLDDFNFLGVATRSGQKSLTCAAIELLMLVFDHNRDYFHMASIYDQSKVTYNYVQSVLQKPLMAPVIQSTTMKETVAMSGRTLKIGTGTIKSVNSNHGCIAGNQRVGVPSGFLKLDNIFAIQGTKPTKIETDTGLRKVIGWKDSGIQPCYKITTQSGRELIATANHMIQVFAGQMAFKRLDELKVGDILTIRHTEKWPRTPFQSNKFQSILPNSYKTVEDLAYVVGRAVGDGCLTVKDRITITTGVQSDVGVLKDILKSIYPDMNVRSCTHAGGTAWDVIIHSAKIKERWADLGVGFVTAHQKSVPEFIFNQTRGVFYQFLSGYWDADGTSRLRDGRFGTLSEVSFCSKSRQLLLEIQMMLTRDGIDSRIRQVIRYRKTPEYYLVIYGINAVKLANKLTSRLNSTEKKAKLVEISKLHLQDEWYCPRWDKNLIAGLMRKVMTERHSRVRREIQPPQNDSYGVSGLRQSITSWSIRRFLSETVYCADTKEWQTLQYIASAPIWPDKIRSILPMESYNTYDVQVDDRAVWAPNGFVVHNSVFQDEVDLTDYKVFVESKGMLSPGTNGRSPLDVKISSRKFRFGNIQALITKKEQDPSYPLKIHSWGILELTQHCPTERSRGETKNTTLYVDEQNLHAISEEEWGAIIEHRKRNQYVPMKAYGGCLKCGIFSFCKGQIKKQTRDNPYLMKIDDVKRLYLTDDIEFFKSQRLNRKPSSTGLVYGVWDGTKHVLNAESMFQVFSGRAWGSHQDETEELTIPMLIEIMTKAGCRLHLSADFGFNVAVAYIIMRDGADRIYVLDEVVVEGGSDADFALACWERWQGLPIVKGFGDVASPGAIREFSQYFPMLEPILYGEKNSTYMEYAKLSKDYSYRFGLVRKLLSAPGTKEARLFVHPQCIELTTTISIYRNRIMPNGDVMDDCPADGQRDHGPDAMGYGVVGIFVAGMANFTSVLATVATSVGDNRLPLAAPRPEEVISLVYGESISGSTPYVPPQSVPIDPITGKPLDPIKSLNEAAKPRGKKRCAIVFVD